MENDNQNLQFKTNINCSSCVAKVTPFLNDADGMGKWEVDTTSREKILTVKSEGISEQQVVAAVQKAGFKIEPIK